MKRIMPIFCLYLTSLLICCNLLAQSFHWLTDDNDSSTVLNKIHPPNGFTRSSTTQESFSGWLHQLPLKEKGSSIFLYNGQKKANQNAHFAVIDIDTGDKDLQQCADAVIRLYSEYLYSQNKYDDIHFNFTSGDNASFRKWINGYRPIINGNNVTWVKSSKIDSSYTAFRDYLDTIFMYCGTYSLSKELIPVNDIKNIKPGDVFIQGGFPGHAIMVIDVAEDSNKNKLFLLAQGFTPAQDIHILKNPNNHSLSPWYETNFGDYLITPEWKFKKSDLKRFK